MQKRSPAAVFFLSLITFGIYSIVWQVKTKGELNRQGANIPTAWLIIVPLANLYWVWRYAQGAEQVSKGQISAVLTLILMLLLSIVGLAILQSEYNKLGVQPAGGAPAPGGDGLAATGAVTQNPSVTQQPNTVNPTPDSSGSSEPPASPPPTPPSVVQ